MKRIVILGATGSIGRQTLDIVRAFPEEFDVIGLAAGANVELLAEQMQEFHPRHICCTNSKNRVKYINFLAPAVSSDFRVLIVRIETFKRYI